MKLEKTERPHVADEVGEPQGLRDAVEAFEEAHLVGQLPQLAGLLGGHPGGEEVLYASRIVEEGNHAAAGMGQRPRGVQHLLQDGLEVEALVDAEGGLAQRGQPAAQRLVLARQLVGSCHLPLDPGAEARAPVGLPPMVTVQAAGAGPPSGGAAARGAEPAATRPMSPCS